MSIKIRGSSASYFQLEDHYSLQLNVPREFPLVSIFMMFYTSSGSSDNLADLQHR